MEVLRARGGTVISFASCSSVDALERESNANIRSVMDGSWQDIAGIQLRSLLLSPCLHAI